MKTLIFDLDGTLVNLKPNLVCVADVDYLADLRKKYDFALVTGSPKVEVTTALEKCGLTGLFHERNIITHDDIRDSKASGAPFFEIKKRLKSNMVMIGDSDGDEIGTSKAGIPFVRVEACDLLEAQKAKLIESIRRAIELLD